MHHFADDIIRTLLTFVSVIPIILFTYIFCILIEEPCMQWSKKNKV